MNARIEKIELLTAVGRDLAVVMADASAGEMYDMLVKDLDTTKAYEDFSNDDLDQVLANTQRMIQGIKDGGVVEMQKVALQILLESDAEFVKRTQLSNVKTAIVMQESFDKLLSE